MAPPLPLSLKYTRRVHLSVEQKLEILDKLENGTTVQDIIAEYGISKTQVYDIRNAKDKLRNYNSHVESFVSTLKNEGASSETIVSNSASQSHKFMKRVCLTLEKKLEILEKLESGTSVQDIIAEYGISKTQAYDIRSAKDELREYSRNLAHASSRDKKLVLSQLKFRHPKIAKVDEAVYSWYMRKRSTGMTVKDVEIKAAAGRIAVALGVTGFRASNGWVRRFIARHVDKNKPSEAGRQEGKNTARFVRNFQLLYRENNLQDYQIYNADETPLLWKALSNNTHACKWDSQFSHCKTMKSHVSVLLCVNADGSHRLKPMVTGEEHTQNSLRHFMDRLPVHWQCGKPWFQVEIFRTWFMSVFVPAVVDFQVNQKGIRRQDVKALLIYDDNQAHPAADCLASSDGKIKCMRMHADTPTILQPLTQTIALACKRWYRRFMLDDCLVIVPEAPEELQHHKNLQAFKNYNLYDALINLRRGWEAVSTRTLIDAWKVLLGHIPTPRMLSCDFDGFTVAECVSLFHTAGEKEVQEDDVVLWLMVDASVAADPQTLELFDTVNAGTLLDEAQKEEVAAVPNLKLSQVRDNIDELLTFVIATGDLSPFYDDLRRLRTSVVKQQQQMFDAKQKTMSNWSTRTSTLLQESITSSWPHHEVKLIPQPSVSGSEIPAVFIECAEESEREEMLDEDIDLKIEIKEEVVDDVPEFVNVLGHHAATSGLKEEDDVDFLAESNLSSSSSSSSSLEFVNVLSHQMEVPPDPKEDPVGVLALTEPSLSTASTSSGSVKKASAAIPQVDNADEFHLFGMFVATQLRALPLGDALQAQLEIQTLLAQKRTQRLT